VSLATTYLGLELAHPVLPGAGPLSADLETVRRLEDAGAPAIVLPSLFEEQITGRFGDGSRGKPGRGGGVGGPTSPFPTSEELGLDPDEYFEHLRRTKDAVSVPVVASLNGTTAGGWLETAGRLAAAGADALELNVYRVPTDPDRSPAAIEADLTSLVRRVVATVEIPVAIKLSPYHTNLAHLARELDAAGASGLVLFNRFYQPDLDLDALEPVSTLRMSDSTELGLRLRWLAILSGEIGADLAATGGVHEPADVIKAVLAGAHAVQVVSALLVSGPDRLRTLVRGVERWMERAGHESLADLRGTLSLRHCPDAEAFDRANYLRTLRSWKPAI
jgi:dihydroorotate dehydrogenase (fumarate)